MEFLFLLGGVLIGSLITWLIVRQKPIGTLRCDYSDPDSGPYLFLELSSSRRHLIEKKKIVSFKVDLSQK